MLSRALQRLKVLVAGTSVGALCLGLYTAGGLPSAWSFGQKVEAWGLMLTGPLLPVIFEASHAPTAVSVAAALAWLSSPLLFAYAARPKTLTACLTVMALFWWFVVGWLTMVWATWGA